MRTYTVRCEAYFQFRHQVFEFLDGFRVIGYLLWVHRLELRLVLRRLFERRDGSIDRTVKSWYKGISVRNAIGRFPSKKRTAQALGTLDL